VQEAVWKRLEGRFAGGLLVLRDAQQIQAYRLADGSTAWAKISAKPVAGIELMGQLVLVAADHVSAYSAATGVTAWQAQVRGARMAVTADGDTVLLAADGFVSALDSNGGTRWRVKLPDSVAAGVPDVLTVDGDTAYLTVASKPPDSPPLDVDVLAISVV
jgi:outer membrane protein assembly factor BamB